MKIKLGKKNKEKNKLATSISENMQKIRELDIKESDTNAAKFTLQEYYKDSTETLRIVYNMRLIDPRYHNFVAMSSFHFYLESNLCLWVAGPGGVITRYEDDLRFQAVFSMMMGIRDILKDIRSISQETQGVMYAIKSEAVKANEHLTAIERSMAANVKNTDEIRSTANSIASDMSAIRDRYA